jgi:salicylate hydroxylase
MVSYVSVTLLTQRVSRASLIKLIELTCDGEHRVQKLLALLPEEMEKWRLTDLPTIHNWVHSSGKMVIIGDAVHATLPYLAQGAAMAIEDAAVLGSALSHATSVDDIPRLLQFFYRARVDRAHAIQRGSFTNRFFIHMRDEEMLAMRRDVFRAGDYPSSPNLMGNTVFQDWLYGYDAVADAALRWEREKGALIGSRL